MTMARAEPSMTLFLVAIVQTLVIALAFHICRRGKDSRH
jgi:hypothetical protein